MDCIFCKIINGSIPSYKIYEDDKILAFLDVNPVNPGHTLIIPKEHTLDITTISNDVLVNIFDKSKDIANILINKMDADGFTLVQNNGIAQEVKHFHIHITPSSSNSEFSIKANKDLLEDLDSVYEKLTN